MKLNELFTYFSIAYLFSLVNGCIIKQIFPEPIPLNNFKSPNVWPSIFNIKGDRYLWQKSGLYQADIVPTGYNGIGDTYFRWPGGIVPYYLHTFHFSDRAFNIILRAMDEFQEATCIRFRPVTEDDDSWIHIKGTPTGCWSYVGRQYGGQILNLSPGCIDKETIMHELLHALGFYHQQSTYNRDDYVEILWENIEDGYERDFQKFPKSEINDFGYGYDYDSLMHYPDDMFSKNGNPTIRVLQPGVRIGLMLGLSTKDILKLRAMYKDYC